MGSPRAPKRLAEGGPGRALWKSITKLYELRPDELRILEDACFEADLIESLDEAYEGQDHIVQGSMKQPVANPILVEIRQHRSALAGLLAKLKLGQEEGSGKSGRGGNTTSTSARKAAEKRWSKTPVKRGA